MNKQAKPIKIIEHLFEFWESIALSGHFLNNENEYTYTNPTSRSWPSKIFRIDANKLNFEDLKVKIKNETKLHHNFSANVGI